MKKTQNKSYKKLIILLLLAVVTVITGVGALLHSNRSQDNSSLIDNTSKTTSDVESAQSDFTSNDMDKGSANTPRVNSGSGGIIDSKGTAVAPTDTSNSTASSSGKIVVYAPTKNTLLVSDSTVSGTSSLSQVSYRIIDTDTGVISTGNLSVVNGKFSGTIQFQTNAKDGKLDFFGTQSDGNEFDNISIPVRFK